jgi:subtilisin family serine protease
MGDHSGLQSDQLGRRYVIGRVRSGEGQLSEEEASDSLREFMAACIYANSDAPPVDSVLRAAEIVTESSAAMELERLLPAHLTLEPLIEHDPLVGPAGTESGVPASDHKIKIKVLDSDGRSLEGIKIGAQFVKGTEGVHVVATTDRNGSAEIQFQSGFVPHVMVVAPDSTFWKQVIVWDADWEEIEVTVTPLAMDGPISWWHRRVGVVTADLSKGLAIRIGILDSGLGAHSHLRHVEHLGAFLGGGHNPDNHEPIGSHGTHVAGIIGSRCDTQEGFAGFAPAASLYCARVFPDDGGASQADLANGIEALTTQAQVHLINLSLGAPMHSRILQDAILDAYEMGTVCVCAAGNSGGDIQYPAALPACISVGALGDAGHYPLNSLSAWRESRARATSACGLFVADFSCSGPGLDCAATGVGLISTVNPIVGNSAPYGVMDGTSMAAPVVTGYLAAMLAADPDFAKLESTEERSEYIKVVLEKNVREIGFGRRLEGRGCLVS